MSGFSELIKNFGRTRDYVRDFFIYGFKVRGDFDRKSSRSYDDERRRVESWLGDHIHYDDSKRGRQFSLTADSGHLQENPLYQAYYACSFTDNDIRLHFLLSDLLTGGGSYTISELTELLYTEYGAVFEAQTVRGKLKEYADMGVFIVEKRGNKAYYRLSADTLDIFSADCPGLEDAIRFFSEMQPFGVIGNSILQSTGLRNNCFIMKHNYIVRALEDEMLCTILQAIDEHRTLELRIFSSHNYHTGTEKEHKSTCIPLRISTSVQSGRRYLIAYMPASQRLSAMRTEYIQIIRTGEVCDTFADYQEMLERNLPHVFGASFGMRDHDSITSPLFLTLRVEEKEDYIPDRIRREMRCGSLEQIGDGIWRVTLDIFDPQEALPWIRTFTGRILSIAGGTAEVRQKLIKDMYDTAALYSGKEEPYGDLS